MKYFNIVKFIMDLTERDRLIAILLVAVGALYTQNEFHTTRMINMSEKYKNDLASGLIACDVQKDKIMQNDIISIHKARELIDSLATINLTIIRNNNNQNTEKKQK